MKLHSSKYNKSSNVFCPAPLSLIIKVNTLIAPYFSSLSGIWNLTMHVKGLPVLLINNIINVNSDYLLECGMFKELAEENGYDIILKLF